MSFPFTSTMKSPTWRFTEAPQLPSATAVISNSLQGGVPSNFSPSGPTPSPATTSRQFGSLFLLLVLLLLSFGWDGGGAAGGGAGADAGCEAFAGAAAGAAGAAALGGGSSTGSMYSLTGRSFNIPFIVSGVNSCMLTPFTSMMKSPTCRPCEAAQLPSVTPVISNSPQGGVPLNFMPNGPVPTGATTSRQLGSSPGFGVGDWALGATALGAAGTGGSSSTGSMYSRTGRALSIVFSVSSVNVCTSCPLTSTMKSPT
mmetsp:Transcript_3140/g.6948  ORF Transcript_3140/g.6948 Transcript_3140/m.6948 type:complete len:257 (+) Transcript_3140:194-964(+)